MPGVPGGPGGVGGWWILPSNPGGSPPLRGPPVGASVLATGDVPGVVCGADVGLAGTLGWGELAWGRRAESGPGFA